MFFERPFGLDGDGDDAEDDEDATADKLDNADSLDEAADKELKDIDEEAAIC